MAQRILQANHLAEAPDLLTLRKCPDTGALIGCSYYCGVPHFQCIQNVQSNIMFITGMTFI